jgi:hypothetical protein
LNRVEIDDPDFNTIDVDDEPSDEDGENWNLPNTKGNKKVTPKPFNPDEFKPKSSATKNNQDISAITDINQTSINLETEFALGLSTKKEND